MKKHRRARGKIAAPTVGQQILKSAIEGNWRGFKQLRWMALPALILGGLSVDKQTPTVIACEIGFGALTAFLGSRACKDASSHVAVYWELGDSFMANEKKVIHAYAPHVRGRARWLGRVAAGGALVGLLATGGCIFEGGRAFERSQPSPQFTAGEFGS